jgi:DNA-binding response OmpR family regulator
VKKILIIEDDSAIAAIERDYLEIDRFAVDIVSDGINGLKQALDGAFDLILLDLMLPGLDGFSVCRKLREKLDIPILMVTAKQEDIDKIRGLGIGADDYIEKPFSPSVLVARVKANLAQYERLKECQLTVAEPEIKIGNIRINTGAHRVYVMNEEISLKNKEYELLLFLVKNADMVFDKETLYERIWGYDALGDAATVAVHINRLREKIEADSGVPQYIQTVWGAGYRFKI